MSLLQMAAIAGNGAAQTYADDVLSAYTYTGNGSTQTINNGIDLAGQGGLVWCKSRDNGASWHLLCDSALGVPGSLYSNSTNAHSPGGTGVTAFNPNGFSVGAAGYTNANGEKFISWSFRKAPKFFDVQTVTKTGGSDATVNLSALGTVGMVAVKRTDSTSDWFVFHRSCTSGKLVYLNTTAAETTDGSVTLSGTTLHLVDGVIADGSYVVYAWANDASTDGIAQCGSFTTDGSGNATVTLGWEPQYVMWKISAGGTEDWYTMDSSRGLNVTGYARLNPNTSAVEGTASSIQFAIPTATGFDVKNENPSSTYIYLAIRRPNKPPTLGTQVYNAATWTGNSAARSITGYGLAPDSVWIQKRNDAGSDYGNVYDRLRGKLREVYTGLASAEGSSYTATLTDFGMDGFSLGTDDSGSLVNNNSKAYIGWVFRRAPGVFDQVCYTGTGAAHTEAHNLGVAPELMIVKKRSAADGGVVYSASLGANYEGYLFDNVNGNAGFGTPTDKWNSTLPTSTVFSLSANAWVNASSATYVAYLFATKAGISKVGSYTGNGSSQTINCGFTTGARFVLIKRTDSTGDWFVWDSTRGIVAGNDPHLSLNTIAAEVTTDDSIDPDTSGFIVNQDGATNINVTSATYIYLAFA